MTAGAFDGTRVAITGATDGIGLATAERLARAGAHVVIHGRSVERLRAAREHVGADAQTVQADLASLDEVRGLADALARGPRLDVLINNAGIGGGPPPQARETSRDGFELRWAVNFLAPFALTEWLIASGHAPLAVVNIASLGQAPIDFGDLQATQRYDGWQAYRQSKLALIAWTFELAARRPSLRLNALHPGTFLATKMVTEAGVQPRGSVDSGAAAVVALTELTLAGTRRGAFFDVREEARALEQAYDRDVQQRLRREAAQSIAPFGRGLEID